MTRQKELQKKGFANLDGQLKEWLNQVSKPLDANAFDGSGIN